MTKPKGEYQAARVSALADDILRFKASYYAGKPEISDAAYDALEDELRAVSPSHPALLKVGADSVGGVKVAHTQPMLSLNKTYDEADLLAWAGDRPVVGTVKVDGVSLSLTYTGDAAVKRLALAKTRGNGVFGEDVTDKARWISDLIPELSTPGKEGTSLEIRGELYCTEPNFLRLVEEFERLGLDRPTSPRNIVAGLLGRKTKVELARFFNFFAFQVVDGDLNFGLKTEMEMMAWLEKLGFTPPYPRRLTSAAGFGEYLEFVKNLGEKDDVGIDGAVFSYDELALHRDLGATAHHPRAKLSFKWAGETATTTIETVAWATSRLGIVTPVAVVKPVFLSGASITNVTLHNAAHVKAFNLKAKDEIEIIRSGEVIPKFLMVVKAAAGAYVWPETCPACGAPLAFDDVRLKCANTAACPAQRLGTIINWIQAAGIDDLSEKRLTPLIDQGLVRSMADLYRLKESDFLAIPNVKEKMAAKLFANIKKSRTLPLQHFLRGLGIEGAGGTTWEKLLEVFHGLSALRTATAEAIVDVPGFAEKSADQIVQGLAVRANLIEELLAAGVAPRYEPPTKLPEGAAKLTGKTFVITGELSRPRPEFEKMIKAAGGKMGSSVSSNTFAVVTNDPGSKSSKMKKARDLGIAVWSEADLMASLA